MNQKIITDIDEINKRIRNKNISISKIAVETGFSRITVWRYLNKKREAKLSFLQKVSEIV